MGILLLQEPPPCLFQGLLGLPRLGGSRFGLFLGGPIPGLGLLQLLLQELHSLPALQDSGAPEWISEANHPLPVYSGPGKGESRASRSPFQTPVYRLQ